LAGATQFVHYLEGDDEVYSPIAYDIPMSLILSACNPVCNRDVLQEMAAVARDLEQWTPDPPAKVLAIVDRHTWYAKNRVSAALHGEELIINW